MSSSRIAVIVLRAHNITMSTLFLNLLLTISIGHGRASSKSLFDASIVCPSGQQVVATAVKGAIRVGMEILTINGHAVANAVFQSELKVGEKIIEVKRLMFKLKKNSRNREQKSNLK